MKRALVGLVAVAALIVAPSFAWAGTSYCESTYFDGEECWTQCWHWADDGTYLGHVIIDYNCV